MGEQTQIVSQIFKDLGDINFVLIAIVVVGAFVANIVIERVLPWIGSRLEGRVRQFLLPLVPLLRLIIIVVAAVEVITQIVTPTQENLFAVFGAVGIAVGLALRDYVSGLIAGVVALYERPYRVGDWVQIDDTYGEVKSVGLRALKVLTPDDTMVSVAHSKIWTANINNANDGKSTHLCVADFYLHPEHDAGDVSQRLRDVALTSAYLDLQKPVALVVSEKPWGTHYRLKAYPLTSKMQYTFTTDLTVRGKHTLMDAKVKLTTVPMASGPA